MDESSNKLQTTPFACWPTIQVSPSPQTFFHLSTDSSEHAASLPVQMKLLNDW
jgi:hypothetical protein